MNKSRSAWTAVCLVLGLCASAATAGDEAKGVVSEGGWGKFKMVDTNGAERLFYESSKLTQYAPDTWRPAQGDEVLVHFSEVVSRSRIIVQVDKVTLVQAGPNTALIESPVEVELVQIGRTGYMGKPTDGGPTVRFLRHRRTRLDPPGWRPLPGEKVRIEFRCERNRGFSVNRIADRVERLAL